MNWTYIGIAAYLALGAFLTHLILMEMHRPRRRIRDFALGAVLAPILLVVLLLLLLFEKLWARLVIILDLEPPENMRAGPTEPASGKSTTKDES
tara:strand:+ start:945 stop:1226 length:282 start_codon:yes stop_codon:yes gene_type:complete